MKWLRNLFLPREVILVISSRKNKEDIVRVFFDNDTAARYVEMVERGGWWKTKVSSVKTILNHMGN